MTAHEEGAVKAREAGALKSDALERNAHRLEHLILGKGEGRAAVPLWQAVARIGGPCGPYVVEADRVDAAGLRALSAMRTPNFSEGARFGMWASEVLEAQGPSAEVKVALRGRLRMSELLSAATILLAASGLRLVDVCQETWGRCAQFYEDRILGAWGPIHADLQFGAEGVDEDVKQRALDKDQALDAYLLARRTAQLTFGRADADSRRRLMRLIVDALESRAAARGRAPWSATYRLGPQEDRGRGCDCAGDRDCACDCDTVNVSLVPQLCCAAGDGGCVNVESIFGVDVEVKDFWISACATTTTTIAELCHAVVRGWSGPLSVFFSGIGDSLDLRYQADASLQAAELEARGAKCTLKHGAYHLLRGCGTSDADLKQRRQN